MLTANDIWDDAEVIFGICDETKLLVKISDAVELLVNKGEIETLVGFVDICVDGQAVTLPREVETVLGVNIGGHPAIGRDELFSFHLNGPGDFCTSCRYSWENVGAFPTYKDIRCPSKLVSFVDNAQDAGKKLRVFGYDEHQRQLRQEIGGVWYDGYLVPTIYGYAVPEANAPRVARITYIEKDLTVANIRLSSYDNDTNYGTLIGVFEPTETRPSYRRIKLSHCADWVRLAYRRRSNRLTSRHDRILLHSRPALLLSMRAIKKYEEAQLSTALAFEAQATRLLTEKESVLTSPTANPIQVNDRAGLKTYDIE